MKIYVENIITEILKSNKCIRQVAIVEFPSGNLVQDRVSLSPKENRTVREALKIREHYHLPFWDSLLLTQFVHDKFSPTLIDQAVFHNQLNNIRFISRRLWKTESLKLLQTDKNLGFTSRVITSTGNRLHLPLLDFHVPGLASNAICVKEVLKKLKLRGYLLQTNKSFHFYGDCLISQSAFHLLLAKAILFTPIIDKNWIAHQLIEKAATLRITQKEGGRPFLLERIK